MVHKELQASKSPTTVSISQWPHSILSEAISGRSSILDPRMRLFLRALCALWSFSKPQEHRMV